MLEQKIILETSFFLVFHQFCHFENRKKNSLPLVQTQHTSHFGLLFNYNCIIVVNLLIAFLKYDLIKKNNHRLGQIFLINFISDVFFPIAAQRLSKFRKETEFVA